jgi:hypothetical protein
MITTFKPSQRIGLRVRVLTGAAAGCVGVITNANAGTNSTWYKVFFAPPVFLPAAGYVASVWRRDTDIQAE